MSYHIKYSSKDQFHSMVSQKFGSWHPQLEQVQQRLNAISALDGFQGEAADAIKAYFSEVHGFLLMLLMQTITDFNIKLGIYSLGYYDNIDEHRSAILPHAAFPHIQGLVTADQSYLYDEGSRISGTLSSISDILPLSNPSQRNLLDAMDDLKSQLSALNVSIEAYESTHCAEASGPLAGLIATLYSAISSYAHGDHSITGYTSGDYASNPAMLELFEKACESIAYTESHTDILLQAIENENERIAALQAEYEARQQKAQTAKWIAAGVCIVGSIAALAIIVGTGGAATPLVVGTVSAVSGAVMAGTNNLADQYVEKGTLKDADWLSFGKDVLVAGIAGFATGFISAGLGSAISSGLSKLSVGKTLLNSTSGLTRIGTHAVIGSVSEVGSGIAARGAATLIATGFDVKEAFSEALDPGDILLDAALGGANGAFDQTVSVKKAQDAADAAAADYNLRYDPLEAGEANGLEGLKPTKNHGVDFKDSDYILRTESGEPFEVKIKATGNRQKDYALAEQAIKEKYGVDMDLASMRTKDGTHVWHHMDDYNAFTNETTMQFIDKKAHVAIENHTGSAKQYSVANGHGYSKQVKNWEPYEGFDVLEKTSPAINTGLDAAEDARDTAKQESPYFGTPVPAPEAPDITLPDLFYPGKSPAFAQ